MELSSFGQNSFKPQSEENEPIIIAFSFIISSGTVYEDLFCHQPKIIKYLEKNCNCTIKLSHPHTASGPLIGYHLVDVEYDISYEGHRAFMRFMQHVGQMIRAIRGTTEKYRVVKTQFL